jgi:DNA-binding transcriptional LysR family regulator
MKTSVCAYLLCKSSQEKRSMEQWDDVRFFLAISRERSLSGAARVLGVDHATVGRRLVSFERRLNAQLFNRTPEGFAITSAGQAILNQAEGMEVAAQAVERLLAGHDARSGGLVRLATIEALAYQVILPTLAKLQEKHQQLRVDLLVGLRTLDIARWQADIAVRIPRPTDSSLIGRKLGEFGVATYASTHYLAVRGTPKRGAGLSGHSVINYLGAPAAFGPPFLGESLEGTRVTMHTTSTFVQIKAVADGIGIGDLPCCIADDHPELRRVWPDERPTMRQVWLVTHQDLRRAAKIRLVSNAIAEAFERDAAILRYGRLRKSKSTLKTKSSTLKQPV